MNATRNIWLLVFGLVFLTAGIFWKNLPAASVESLVEDAASRQLNRPVAVKVDLKNEIDGWVFVCGVVTEPDGSDLKIESEGSEAAYESDNFCALAKVQGKQELSEFDFGSTDMPAMDWLERYDLSTDILTAGEG